MDPPRFEAAAVPPASSTTGRFDRAAATAATAVTTPPPATSAGISAIAARIRERAGQLASEQDALAGAEQELESAHASLTQQCQRSQAARRAYLQSAVQASTVELECGTVQDLIAEREARTRQLKQQESRMEQEIAKQKADWAAVVDVNLARHTLRQELYQKHLLGAIHARHQAVARRAGKLETAARLALQWKRDRETIMGEQQRVQANMMRMTEAEDDASNQVESLALQVRQSLAKVGIQSN